MSEFVFTLQGLRKVVPPDQIILDGITLAFLPGAKIGVIGPNGSGKSSLLRIMAGLDGEHMGTARPAPGLRIGYLPQEPDLDPAKDVRGNVEDGIAETRDLLARFEEISGRFSEPMDAEAMDALLREQGRLQDRIEAAGAWELDRTLERAMDALRCPTGDAGVASLSGGERRRVALARLLVSHPDMLLLDEPTNHLDAESVEWLEHYLRDYEGTVVAVTHDRYFLDNVAGWILELDAGKGIPWKGNYASWLEQKSERLARSEKQESARRRALRRELEWVRTSSAARGTRNKARLKQYGELRKEAASPATTKNEISIPPGPRLGDIVIRTRGLGKGFGDRILIDKLDLDIPRGAIVGIIGANGVGKTTLFRLILGQEKPDAGSVVVGETVHLAYVDQERTELSADRSVWEEVSGGAESFEVGGTSLRSRAYLASFGFRGAAQQKPVGALSGGERNRLHLAKLLRSGGNVLLLDEPTNDLDVDTLRALEEALLDFAGCVLVISHDRWFLDRIGTHILAFEGDSRVRFVEGNYQDYEKDRRQRLGEDATRPHRVRFKRLAP